MIIAPFDNLASNIQSLIDAGSISAGAKIEFAEYDGTDSFSNSSLANSLTFDFAPKVVICLGWRYSYSGSNPMGIFRGPDSEDDSIVLTDLLTTSYQVQRGFNSGSPAKSYGKKSADGKTISWYNGQSAVEQLNSSGYTYYFLALA